VDRCPCPYVVQLFADGVVWNIRNVDLWAFRDWYSREVDYLCYVDTYTLPNFDQIGFSDTALRSMKIQNAGGSSNISEALSMYYFQGLITSPRAPSPTFVPECEVDYWIEYKMCDFLMTWGNVNIGVSVTRAVRYPFEIEYTVSDGLTLLKRKLDGLIIARNAVNTRHQFFKSILHVWCYSQTAAVHIQEAYHQLVTQDHTHVYDHICVICTYCPTRFIYTNHLFNE
jgi:hypothetical protein